MKTKKINFFLLIILGLSLLSHLVYLKSLPPALNWDEISLGYNSYSILKTGKDEWGIKLPLIFRCYGDYKLPLYIYLSVPLIALFGLNTLSVRLLSIICGTLLPLVVYFIIKKLSPKNKSLPIIAALIIAFSPWSIFLSRIALEAQLFCFLFCLSFYYLINKNYSISSLIFALCLFSYNSSKVILPFYLIILIYLIIKSKTKINILKFTPILLAIFIIVYQILNPSGQARYEQVTILDQGAINQINELRAKYPRFLVNKVTYFTYNASKNYLAHFNPKFLFKTGGSHYQFNIPNFYLLSPLLIPFLLLGLFYLIKDKKYELIYFWLISPIPSAITRDAPHTLRSIGFLLCSTIIIAYGFLKINKKLALTITILILVLTQFEFWPKYFNYQKQYAKSWQYGYEEVIKYTTANYSKYSHIAYTKFYDQPHEFILFFTKYNPNLYQKTAIWDYHSDWYWVDGFDKYQFINDWEIKDYKFLPDTLLVTSPANAPSNATLIDSIYYPDQTKVFEIYQIK